MSERNILFKKAQEQLEEGGLSKTEAIDFAFNITEILLQSNAVDIPDTRLLTPLDEGVKEEKGYSKFIVRPRIGPINNMDVKPVDICSDIGPSCRLFTDLLFRRNDGTCNNLRGKCFASYILHSF